MITCSNCGKHRGIATFRGSVRAAKDGWRARGSSLYCPECVRTWKDRNGTDFPEDMGWTIDEAFIRISEQAGIMSFMKGKNDETR